MGRWYLCSHQLTPLRSKVRRLLTWIYTPRVRYSVAVLPPTATWGEGFHLSRYLCMRGEAVTICVVSAVKSYRLCCEMGQRTTLKVEVALIRDVDREAARDLLCRGTSPHRTALSHKTLGASNERRRRRFLDSLCGCRNRSERLKGIFECPYMTVGLLNFRSGVFRHIRRYRRVQYSLFDAGVLAFRPCRWGPSDVGGVFAPRFRS